MVWNHKGPTISSDVHGQFVSRAGALVGPDFAIDADSAPSDNPMAVAFDEMKYFVAFSDEVGGAGSGAWDTFGRFVTPTGTILTNRIPISTTSGAQRFPSVAFDGINYLVSWSDGLTTTNSSIKFRFFNTNGQPMSSEFSGFAAQGTNLPVLANVLFDVTRYTVVASLGVVVVGETGKTEFQSGDVYGTFISPLPKGTFPIAINGGSAWSLSAAFDGTNYLAAIEGDQTSKEGISAQLFSPNGALIGSRISLGRTGGLPIVAFDGTSYLMAWEDTTGHNANSDIYGQFISPSGALVRPLFAISATGGPQGKNRLVFDGLNYLVVWTDGRNGNANTDIYGQLVTPAGTLFGAEIPIATDAESQQAPSLAFDGANFFVVWQSRRSSSPELYDTYGKFISRAGVPGLDF